MIKISKNVVKAVEKHLEERYLAEGKDYYFRSRHLSKEVPISAHAIGRVAMLMSIEGGPVKLVNKSTHSACLFRTCFRGK